MTGNSANHGGGAADSTLYNCIVYYNTAPDGPNYYDASLYYCCSTPLPGAGAGNLTDEPLFMNPATGDFRLAYGSPCIDAGTNLSALITTDLDGNPRPLDGTWDGVAAFDMGAYEYHPQTADSNMDGRHRSRGCAVLFPHRPH